MKCFGRKGTLPPPDDCILRLDARGEQFRADWEEDGLPSCSRHMELENLLFFGNLNPKLETRDFFSFGPALCNGP
jgi:hypothetical protein